MKRASELRSLSNDYHHALVLAKKAKRAIPEGNLAIADIWKR